MKYFEQRGVVFLNGQWILAEDAQASIYNQTMHYGLGVFDGLRSYKNAEGCNIFAARTHYDRLIHSASLLNLQISYSSEELVHVSYELLDRNNLDSAYIRPLIWQDPNMALTNKSKANIFIGAWPWQKYLGHDPVSVMVSRFKKPGPEFMPVNHKVCGNYPIPILASTEARKLGYDEALLLDQHGFIGEGPAANIFFESEGKLFTPKPDNIFAGITRLTIMELAKKWGIEVVEKDMTLEEAYKMEYAFFAGTATEITPIKSINGEFMKEDWEDSQSHNLYMLYRRLVTSNEFEGLTIV